MSEPKLYFVSEAFPPRGRGGPQIAARMARCLAEEGWDIRVICEGERNGFFCKWSYDYKLYNELREQMAIEVIGRFRWGVIGELMVSLGLSPSLRMDWVRKATAALDGLVDRDRDGIIVASYPDIASMFVGREMKRRYGFPMAYHLQDDLRSEALRPGRIRRKLRKLEHGLLHAADFITVTSETVKRNLVNNLDCPAEKVDVVINGYDKPIAIGDYPAEADRPFRALYAGSIAAFEKPEVLNLAYQAATQRHPDVGDGMEVVVYGQKSHYYRSVYKKTLCEGIHFHEFVPYEQLVRETVGHVDVGFVGTSEAGAYAMQTKLFDYVNFEIPILAAVPDGETKQLIEAYDIGKVVHYTDVDGLAEQLYELYANPDEMARLTENVRRAKPSLSMKAQVRKQSEALRRIHRAGRP